LLDFSILRDSVLPIFGSHFEHEIGCFEQVGAAIFPGNALPVGTGDFGTAADEHRSTYSQMNYGGVGLRNVVKVIELFF